MGIQTPEEGRAAVRKQAEAGVDMIKVYSRLDKDVFLAIVEEAQKHGLKVVAHLPESVYIEDAAVAGLRSSEHFNGFEKVIAKLLGEPVKLSFAGQASEAGYFQRLGEVNPEELRGVYQRIRASGMTVCPTVVTFKTLTNLKAFQAGSFPRSEYISPSVMDLWKSLWAQQDDLPDFIWQNWVQMVSELNKAGVPLMVGTDLMLPGIIPGYSVHEEMVIWQEAGIAPAEVLRSATIVPSQFMGLGDRLGSVSEGKTASIVLVRANPLEDIRNAQQIEGVFLRGQFFSRKDLDRLLDEAKDLAQQSMP
jgi:imidazolonepropionase-like amidohydrolase